MMIVKLEIISLIAHMSCGLETGPSAINDTLYFGLADRLDFDNNVLAFVQKIIEKGIPKADVPPLDPLYIKNTAQLGYWHFPGIVELNKADISNSTILNVGSFEGNPFSFKFALSPPWKVNFTFVYNSIYGYGRNMSVDLIVGDMIPFFTDGEFSFNITDVTIIGSMSIETDSNEYITISSLTADISLGGLKTNIANATTGQSASIGELVSKLFGNIGPELVEKFKTFIVPKVLEVLRVKINELLVRLDAKVLNFIPCLTNSESETCPFF